MPQRYRAQLAYNGARYHGFQLQTPAHPTIQGHIEAALQSITQQQVRVVGGGRTDTGVHARGQVIAFDCEWRHSPQALCKALNAALPHDIVLQDVTVAPNGFHPRFDAVSRLYHYHCYTAPVRDPLWDLTSWHVGSTLDLEAVQAAAHHLIGQHDFATFGQAPYGNNTVRFMYQAHLQRENQQQFHFVFEANAFLTHMVRSMVGTLLEVGQGQRTVAHFVAGFQAAQRQRAARTAPPQGLILVSIKYGGSTALEYQHNANQNLDTKSE
jgi:tRNA pseudouridine38-40 synthase